MGLMAQGGIYDTKEYRRYRPKDTLVLYISEISLRDIPSVELSVLAEPLQ